MINLAINGGAMNSSSKPTIPRWLPDPLPQGAEYVLTIKEYIRTIRDDGFIHIKEAAVLCADAYAEGKRIIYPFYGHSERKGIAEAREGRPGFLTYVKDAEVSEGDAFITIHAASAIEAKEKGAKVIGISNAFLPSKPGNYLTIDRKAAESDPGDFYTGPFLEDHCDVFIDDQVPYTVGIIAFDGLKSHFGNGVGIMEGYVFWTLTAAIADHLLERGITFDVLDHSD